MKFVRATNEIKNEIRFKREREIGDELGNSRNHHPAFVKQYGYAQVKMEYPRARVVQRSEGLDFDFKEPPQAIAATLAKNQYYHSLIQQQVTGGELDKFIKKSKTGINEAYAVARP